MKAKNNEELSIIDQLDICFFDGTYNRGRKRGTVDVAFHEYIDSTRNADEDYIKKVQLIRQVKRCKTLTDARKLNISKTILAKSKKVKDVYSMLKWRSLHVYPSCTFDKNGCRLKNIIAVSGLLVYDLQGVDQDQHKHLVEWKHTVCMHKSIGGQAGDYALFLYCPGLTVDSFRGIWEKGNELIKSNFGLEPDNSDECKDVTRIRYLSYDPDIVYNQYAEPVFIKDIVISTVFTSAQKTKINKYLNSEPNWFRFGLAIAKSKGEEGRDLYHIFSKENKQKYDSDAVDEKYNRLLVEAEDTRENGLNSGTLFYLLKKMGVTYLAPRLNSTGVEDGEAVRTQTVLEYLNGRWVRNEINDKILDYTTGEEVNVETIWTEFQLAFDDPKRFPINTLHALLRSKRMNTINPLKNFFSESELEYDGGNYIEQFVDTLPVKDRESTRLFITYWCIQCYLQTTANITNRTFLIMKGPEEIGKSRALGWFCPLDGYLKTGPLNTDNKDTRIALAHNFLWNDDELKVFRAYDINKIKALISTDVINERSPYSRSAETMKRICNFCGSTNADEILPSTEGNTRFLVVELTTGNPVQWVNYMKIPKKQFWGEIINLYNRGWVTKYKTQMKLNRSRVNEANIINSVIHDALIEMFEGNIEVRSDVRTVYTLKDVIDAFDSEGTYKAMQQQNLVRDILIKEFGSSRTNGIHPRTGERTKGYPLAIRLYNKK